MSTLRNHTHCQLALGHRTNQNLPKSMATLTHGGNLKIITQNEKHENLTKCIVNALSSDLQLFQQFDTLVILESVRALTIHKTLPPI